MGTVEREIVRQPALPSGRQWLREALANCYVHSPLPRVVRRLRNGYSLTARPQSTDWPRVTMKKRRQASARILIYHRVNDDNDPFFPATSTKLFEAEMRFVSKSYRVVSLTEMLRRLVDGPAEPVLAITFDDGYRDNYTNAFPILQRHGLSGTVFLTTGPMDADEPLWFERLALALKRTEQESLDLETTPPQRLWLRTEAERLSANANVFSVLQRQPDSERRRMLADVLRKLAAPDAGERRGKMLTWDDVRFMSAHGIEFGGHTVSHPFVSRLAADELRTEVVECKRRIENEIQVAAKHFAYPNGRIEDFGLRNKSFIKEAGYLAAVTTEWGLNYPSTDRFELRRGGPWETNAALFAWKLDWYELTGQ